jgi:ABC-2 type transport system permease protein
MPVAVTLTLFFLSGYFFPDTEPPQAISSVADQSPVRHFSVAMTTAFNPDVDGAGFEWGLLAVLALWAVGGGVAGARVFRRTPTADG